MKKFYLLVIFINTAILFPIAILCQTTCNAGTIRTETSTSFGTGIYSTPTGYFNCGSGPSWDPPAFVNNTNGSNASGTETYQWQSSTSSTFASGVTDVGSSSTSASTYNPGNINGNSTTYYRRRMINTSGCTAATDTTYSNILVVFYSESPTSSGTIAWDNGVNCVAADTLSISATNTFCANPVYFSWQNDNTGGGACNGTGNDWIVVSATSFGDVNNGNYHWDADSWSFKAPGQYCKRLNYVCQSGSTFTCYQSNALPEATPTSAGSLPEAGSSGSGSYVNADAGDTIVLHTLLTGEANSGSWSRESGTGGTFNNTGYGATFILVKPVTTSVFKYSTSTTPLSDNCKDFSYVTVNLSKALPINELQLKYIHKSSTEYYLTWSPLKTIYTDQVFLERKTDRDLDFVPVFSPSDPGQSNSFTDKLPYQVNKLYYRIKSVSKIDNITAYSNVLIINQPGKNSIQIYPSLATNTLNILITNPDEKDDWNHTIFNILGTKISSNFKTAGNIINIESLPNGNYILVSTNRKNNVQSEFRFVKNN